MESKIAQAVIDCKNNNFDPTLQPIELSEEEVEVHTPPPLTAPVGDPPSSPSSSSNSSDSSGPPSPQPINNKTNPCNRTNTNGSRTKDDREQLVNQIEDLKNTALSNRPKLLNIITNQAFKKLIK